MPQRAWLFSTAHVIRFGRNLEMKPTRHKKSRSQERDSKRSHGLRELPRMDHRRQNRLIERGTAAQGVPVRQTRVAELGDDVAVLSSGRLEETKRDWRIRAKARGENHAGEDSARRGKSNEISRENFFRTCGERKAHVFSGHGGKTGDHEKRPRARSRI